MTVQDYIGQQPAVISAAIEAAASRLKDAALARPRLLLGSGSSFNALTVAAAALPGDRPFVKGPTDFLREGEEGWSRIRGPVLVLSQSGASTTSIEAARAAANAADVFVVTCEPESPIAKLAFPHLVLPIGGEPIGPKTKGFTATLAGTLAVFAHCGGPVLQPFDGAAFNAMLVEADRAAAALAATLDGLDFLVVSGNRRFTGIALEASLKIAEIAGLPAAGFETEELLHGRLHGLGSNGLVLMIVSTDAERDAAQITAEAMAKRAVRVLLLNLSGQPSRHDWMTIEARSQGVLDTLYAVVPFQWLAVHLAMRRGMRPEAMRYPGLSADLAIKVRAN
jgi:glucoselysine-6-phosphate deglycase